jgi:ribosomal protein S25
MTYQSFLVNMMTTPDAKLVTADPEKLAAKYQIPVDLAKMALKHWKARG